MLRNFQESKFLTQYNINADATMLREFTDLVEYLNFKSSKIIVLKKNFQTSDIRNSSANFKFILVTNNTEMKKMRRCKLSSIKKYVKDNKSLFINHLLNENEKQDENLTSFFVWKLIYSTFFEKSSSLSLKELHSKDIRVEERKRQK